jgi:hypothetical protein
VEGALEVSQGLIEQVKHLQKQMFDATTEQVPGFRENSEQLTVILKEGRSVTLQGHATVQLYRGGKTIILRHPDLEEVGSHPRNFGSCSFLCSVHLLYFAFVGL